MALLIFFFNDTATTEIYTLSLHDALPIYRRPLLQPNVRRSHHLLPARQVGAHLVAELLRRVADGLDADRKSTRLNSSHGYISYAVFCLKKKKKHKRGTNDE